MILGKNKHSKIRGEGSPLEDAFDTSRSIFSNTIGYASQNIVLSDTALYVGIVTLYSTSQA